MQGVGVSVFTEPPRVWPAGAALESGCGVVHGVVTEKEMTLTSATHRQFIRKMALDDITTITPTYFFSLPMLGSKLHFIYVICIMRRLGVKAGRE